MSRVERVTSARLRELFPGARMVCECPSMLDECPASCDRMRVAREAIRGWLDERD